MRIRAVRQEAVKKKLDPPLSGGGESTCRSSLCQRCLPRPAPGSCPTAPSADPTKVAPAAIAPRVIAGQVLPILLARLLRLGPTPTLNGLLSQPPSPTALAATGHGMMSNARMVSASPLRRGTSLPCPKADQTGSKIFVLNVRVATMVDLASGSLRASFEM